MKSFSPLALIVVLVFVLTYGQTRPPSSEGLTDYVGRRLNKLRGQDLDVFRLQVQKLSEDASSKNQYDDYAPYCVMKGDVPEWGAVWILLDSTWGGGGCSHIRTMTASG
jgi:hypothetical protein